MNAFRLMYLLVMPLLLTSLAARAQEEESKKPAKDVPLLCKEVKAEYKNKKNRKVERIIEIYGILKEAYPDAEASHKKEIIKTLKDAFKVRPTVKDKAFLLSAVDCLSSMDKEGLSTLLSVVMNKTLIPSKSADEHTVNACMEVKKAVIVAIGAFKDYRASYKTLHKLLWADERGIVFAACEALACFHDLPLKQRKPMVEEIIKRYARLYSQEGVSRKRGGVGQVSALKYAVKFIGFLPMDKALRKLTGADISDVEVKDQDGNVIFSATPDAWKKWFDEHKKDRKW